MTAISARVMANFNSISLSASYANRNEELYYILSPLQVSISFEALADYYEKDDSTINWFKVDLLFYIFLQV